MKVRNVRHKGLRRLIEDDDRSGIDPAIGDKLLKMVAFLQDMVDIKQLQDIPTWKAHRLTGNNKGRWALHVTKNWRLTFEIVKDELEIIDLDFEDYH